MVFGRNKDKQKKDDYKKIETKEEEEIERDPMKEITKETEEKVNERFEVVKELPTQVIRQVKLEDGTIVNLITVEEALTRFMNEEEEIEE